MDAMSSAVELLETKPRVFWGKVIWLLIQRGWTPPAPDERATDELLDAFARTSRRGAGLVEQDVLSRRQHEVLQLVAEGYDGNEIALALGIAPQTVKYHMTDILSRLDANNRAHAVAIAMRSGFLS